MVNLGDFGSNTGSSAYAVSADGSIVVGSASGQRNGFYWSVGGGLQELPRTQNWLTRPSAVSADGSFVTGSMSNLGAINSVRWSGTAGFQTINPQGTVAESGGMSADGTRIAGWMQVPSGRAAYLWSETGGFVNLGAAPGDVGQQFVDVHAMSGNGSSFVGEADDDATGLFRGYRWTETGGFEYLSPTVPSSAKATNFDGGVIVGQFLSNNTAFYWTADTGMLDLKTLLIQNGATGLEGWRLECTGVSADGRVVTGTAFGPVQPNQQVSAFIAVVPSPATAAPLLALVAIRRRRR